MDKQTAIQVICAVTGIASSLTDNFTTANVEYQRAIVEMTAETVGVLLSDID